MVYYGFSVLRYSKTTTFQAALEKSGKAALIYLVFPLNMGEFSAFTLA